MRFQVELFTGDNNGMDSVVDVQNALYDIIKALGNQPRLTESRTFIKGENGKGIGSWRVEAVGFEEEFKLGKITYIDDPMLKVETTPAVDEDEHQRPYIVMDKDGTNKTIWAATAREAADRYRAEFPDNVVDYIY